MNGLLFGIFFFLKRIFQDILSKIWDQDLNFVIYFWQKWVKMFHLSTLLSSVHLIYILWIQNYCKFDNQFWCVTHKTSLFLKKTSRMWSNSHECKVKRSEAVQIWCSAVLFLLHLLTVSANSVSFQSRQIDSILSSLRVVGMNFLEMKSRVDGG